MANYSAGDDKGYEEEIRLLLGYPLMKRCVKNGCVFFKGSIEIDNEDYKVSIEEHPEHGFVLELSPELKNLQQDFSDIMQQQKLTSVISYLDSLRTYIQSKIPAKNPVNHCDIYRQVLYEYSEFTKFYLNLKCCYLAYELNKINITTVDEQNREHSVEIHIDYANVHKIFCIAEYDLPLEKGYFKATSSLRETYDKFVGLVELLQPFFDLMGVFDSCCHILDPVPQKRMYNYRRILIGENLSLIVTVDPFNVTRIPEIKFLGPQRQVEALRTKMNNNLEKWDQTNDTFTEILLLLGMDHFPEKIVDLNEKEDILVGTGDCSICFSSRLNGKLPEVVCKNEFCENYYHVDCLYEWLMAVNARKFFTEVIGNCPNCEKSISCPIPSV
ncbi:unnamed protein product [Phaedon cochleariae]|uniref:E3 ubiquitin-protein ligase FANCL n=1 Tax=Phaedon cochleariae TaxID=80249 RepID=A0A9P0DHT7_PHACE|nr:unnamed protein product [Phaedon cochleariae]